MTAMLPAQSSQSAQSSPNNQGELLNGRYQLGPMLRREGRIRVCQGWDVSLRRTVLIRILLTDSEAEVYRFRAETKASAELMFEHTVTVFDAGAQQVAGGRVWWAATEFIEDHRPSRLSAADVLDLSRQLAGTMARVHSAGSAHGSLRPDKVFMLPERQLRVGGFGGVGPAESSAGREAVLISDVLGFRLVLLDWLESCPLPSPLRRRLADLCARLGDGLDDFDAIVDALDRLSTDYRGQLAPRTAELPIIRQQIQPQAQQLQTQQALRPYLRRPAHRTSPPPSATFAASPNSPNGVLTWKQRVQRRNSAIAVPGFSILIVLGVLAAFWGLSTLNSQPVLDYRIPVVANSTLADAQAKISAAGFELGGQRTEPSISVPAGQVLATDPVSGQKAAAGSFVVLIVSAGKPQVKLPAATGLSVAALRSKLETANLAVELTEKDGPDAAGTVLAMSPAAGTSVEAGSTVKLTAASGFHPLPTGLLGKTSKEAVAALHALGLTVRIVKAPGFGAAADTVLALAPTDKAPVKGIVTMSVAAEEQ